MAALVEGYQYGLSSKGHFQDNKTRVFVKFTDSALRAIEDYLSIRAGTSRHPTIQFLRNQGVITFPSTQRAGGEHSFNFGLSSAADIEGPQGSYECIQQSGSRSLESLGSMQYKMQIHAKEDVYEATKQRMAVAEEESKKNCTKVIKASGPYVGRKVKRKKHGLVLPPKPTSPPYVGLSNGSKLSSSGGSSSSSSIKPNGASTHLSSLQNNGFHSQFSKTMNVKSSNAEIMRKSYRERIVHLLAVRPYKKPELLARLMKDGIKEKDKKSLSTILSQVASMKDNTYTLAKHAWSEIQEDWPFYSDYDRQLLKSRRIAQNASPPPGGGDDSPPSIQQNVSPNSQQKRASADSDPLPGKKQRISHYSNNTPVGSRTEMRNGHASSAKTTDASQTKSDYYLNGLSKNKTESNGYHHHHNHSQSNGYHQVNSVGSSSSSSNNNNNNNHHHHKLDANGLADSSHSHKSEFHLLNISNSHNSNGHHVGFQQSNNSNSLNRYSTMTLNTNGLTPLRGQDSPECPDYRLIGGGGLPGGSLNGGYTPERSDFDDYSKRYPEITTADQRAQYKADFNSEYQEYRECFAIIDRVSRRFAVLKESLRKVEGTDESQRIKDQIVREYRDIKRDVKYQDAKRKFESMHERLSHIKQMVLDYDREHAIST